MSRRMSSLNRIQLGHVIKQYELSRSVPFARIRKLFILTAQVSLSISSPLRVNNIIVIACCKYGARVCPCYSSCVCGCVLVFSSVFVCVCVSSCVPFIRPFRLTACVHFPFAERVRISGGSTMEPVPAVSMRILRAPLVCPPYNVCQCVSVCIFRIQKQSNEKKENKNINQTKQKQFAQQCCGW